MTNCEKHASPLLQPDAKPDGLISPRRAWSIVFIILILLAVAFVDRNLIGLMVDPIKASFGLTDFRMGILQGSAFAIFFLLGSLPMGWIVDSYSKRLTLFLGVILWSIATIAFGLAGSFLGLFAARALLGLGQAALQPAGWGMVATLFPANKMALPMSMLSSGAQVGVAASYLLGGLLVAEASSFTNISLPVVGQVEPWQFVFLIVGLPGMLLAFLIFAAPEAKKATQASTGQGAGKLAQFIYENRRFLACHFIGFSCMSAMTYGVAAWLPTYLMRVYDLDIRTVGTALAFAQFPICAGGVIFSGWWVDRSFTKGRMDAHLFHFSCVAIGIAIIGGLGFAFSTTAIAVFLCFGFIQFFQPFSGVSGAAIQIATPVEYRGRISAAFIMTYNAVGMTLGPSVVVFLNENISMGSMGAAIAIHYALFGSMAALALYFGRQASAKAVMRNLNNNTFSGQ